MIVSLYIKGLKNQSALDGLTADNTFILIDNTFITADATYNGSITTSDFYYRLELFEDEKISITSSIQNINDISKVFTDYSQSFTIPASQNNNQIFSHWYENDVENGYDQRIKSKGYIEIDGQLFKSGNWQLESSSVKDGRVVDYKITFYGELKSLSDKFQEDKLIDVETLNDYSFEYNGVSTLDKITSVTSQNVMFPFISSKRVWNITSGADNINNSATKLHYRELYPAVKVKTIFNAIEDKYGVLFTGTFLTDKRFTEAFLWFKNKESEFLNQLGTAEIIAYNLDFDGNGFTYEEATYILQYNRVPNTVNASININITFAAVVSFQLKVFKNGVQITTLSGQSNVFNTVIGISASEISANYYFTISTSELVTYTSVMNCYTRFNNNTYILSLQATITGAITSGILNLQALAPDIKVTDFFTGILKLFNLTAFSEDGINFTLEQLEQWYFLGEIKDFSGYTITDFDINRVKPYKKIEFKYQKSESVINRRFFDIDSREYGDLAYTLNNDGSDYTIQLPFENIQFNRFSDFYQVGYAVKSDLKPYIPKPVILYRYDKKDAQYFYFNGTTTTAQTTYNVFGQETLFNGFKNSINWGLEISTLDLTLVNPSLFNNYYLDYLSNLYSLKSRMLKVKMRLPYNEIINLKLNDRIIIRGKRYIVNQVTIDLTTFESDFELLQDFRDVNYNNSGVVEIDNSAQVLRFDYIGVGLWSILSDPNGMVITITQTDRYIDVSLKSNPSGLFQSCSLQMANTNDTLIIDQLA